MSESSFNPKDKKYIEALGARMAYVEHGSGDPAVLVHGNPTSSFLWRHVIPELSDQAWCIAPDLIGMGDSDKVASGPDAYRFVEHGRYLDAFFDAVGIDGNVTLVGHDWGGALAFDWGRRNPEKIKAVAYMETIVTPLTWDDWPEPATSIFQAMRTEAGETIVLEKNVFVERILPSSVLRELTEDEMAVYRAPYLEPGESRRPALTWPREIPIEGEPADVVSIVEANERWLEGPQIPKLFINADPGSILTGRQREICRAWENQQEVTVPGIHFIQEDSGSEIGRAIAGWLTRI